MTTTERWIVAGGGFRGIVGAHMLATAGHDVTLIERAPTLGGVLASVPWKGFHLDKGCHLFANTHDRATEIVVDILGIDNLHPVPVTYASITNGEKTDGFAIPDLGAHGTSTAGQILHELVRATADHESAAATSLQDVFDRRFGPTAGALLAAAARKTYQIDPTHVSPAALDLTQYRRIRFLDDAAADVLKASPALDERVASSSQHDPLRFWREQEDNYPFREFYPSEHGTLGFCEAAEARLRELGVHLRLGTGIDTIDMAPDAVRLGVDEGADLVADRMLWTAGPEPFASIMGFGEELAEYVHHVPLAVFYFVIDPETAGPYTYVHNHDEDALVFRASVPGAYGSGPTGAGNCPPGASYVCCEVPTTTESEVWKDPNALAGAVWDEIRSFGIVDGDGPLDTLAITVPSSYKVPKVGYDEAVTRLFGRVDHHGRVLGAEQWDFAKNDIVESLDAALSG